MALYGSETWAINKKEKGLLKTLEMWHWRKMQTIKRTENITNDDVLKT